MVGWFRVEIATHLDVDFSRKIDHLASSNGGRWINENSSERVVLQEAPCRVPGAWHTFLQKAFEKELRMSLVGTISRVSVFTCKSSLWNYRCRNRATVLWDDSKLVAFSLQYKEQIKTRIQKRDKLMNCKILIESTNERICSKLFWIRIGEKFHLSFSFIQ